jgi:hypothetical protein
MSLSDAAESDLLKLLFQNTAWANVGNAGGLLPSSVAGSFFISLHTADPGEAGTQITNEATFTSYARVAVARASGAGGFTLSVSTISNTSVVTFPTCTGGTNTITYFAIGRDTSGAGEIIVSGALTNQVIVSLGNPIASFAAAALTCSAD